MDCWNAALGRFLKLKFRMPPPLAAGAKGWALTALACAETEGAALSSMSCLTQEDCKIKQLVKFPLSAISGALVNF